MAREVRSFTCAVPAGTLDTAPATFDTSFPPRVVDGVEIVVPAGPSGLVGWRLLVGNAQAIPYLSDPWIITAGEIITWPLEGYPDSGSWSVQAYNTGTNAHAIYLRFLLSLTGGAPARPGIIANDVLSYAPNTG